METIRKTVEAGLCISCGICAGNCPQNNIKLVQKGKSFLPNINTDLCINCGLCYKVCPIHQIALYDGKTDIPQYLLGEIKGGILYAKAKDHEVLMNSGSGGFVTTAIKSLLKRGMYDYALLIEGYNYENQLNTIIKDANSDLSQTSKSRYLTVSHENTIRYMIKHPEGKIIIVATGCAMQGILNTIDLQHLNRKNYLLIGLFCDKTMHQGVVEFFEQHPIGKGRKLDKLYFKSKEAGGWTGNVRLEYTDGSIEDLPAAERMKVKDYFMPKRCLYCLDKLNNECDIAVGDNYIPEHKDKSGSSSIIIRTETGASDWEACKDEFDFQEDDIGKFIESQKLGEKRQNYINSCVEGFYKQNSIKEDKNYTRALQKIEIGNRENVYENVCRDIDKNKMSKNVRRIASKVRNKVNNKK